MKTTRRTLFKLIGGALVASQVPLKLASAAKVPLLYCNGKDCDAAGLEAMLMGEPFSFATRELMNKYVGDYTNNFNFTGLPDMLIKRTVELSGMTDTAITFSGVHGKIKDNEPIFHIRDTRSFSVEGGIKHVG